MKLAVTYPDVEALVQDYLAAEMATVEPAVEVSVGVPAGWKKGSPTHVQVASDGIPRLEHPVLAHATVRLVARASSTGEAKRIAGIALGLLAAHPGGGGIASTAPFTGPLPGRDPDTGAELASATARVTVRSVPITAAS